MSISANIAFFGTPEHAAWALEELANVGITPTVVITAPDRPAGRGRTLTPPPIKAWAKAQDVAILQPETLDDDFIAELGNTQWDAFIVFAYGKILPQALLDIPQKGTLNIHPSNLPKLRGPSPIRSAILRDEPENVGVTIIELDAKMDHGPIVVQARIDLLSEAEDGEAAWPVRGSELDEFLARQGGRLLAEVLPAYIKGEITPEAQDHDEATFCGFLEKADGEIKDTDSDYEKYLKYCAYDGWPGTFFFKNGKRIKITEAHLNDAGEFVIDKVIPEGKKETVWQPNN